MNNVRITDAEGQTLKADRIECLVYHAHTTQYNNQPTICDLTGSANEVNDSRILCPVNRGKKSLINSG